MSRRKGAAPATAGAVPAVLASEILELTESISAHELCVRREYGEQQRKIRQLAEFWTQQRIADLLGVTESRINQIIAKVRKMDETKEHLGSFPYVMFDNVTNAGLIEHMRTGDDKHRELWRKWDAGETIGDIGDLHAIAHGVLGSEEDLVAALELDERTAHKGVCPRCQRTYVLVGLQKNTVRRHGRGNPWIVCDGTGATVVPGEGVEQQ